MSAGTHLALACWTARRSTHLGCPSWRRTVKSCSTCSSTSARSAARCRHTQTSTGDCPIAAFQYFDTLTPMARPLARGTAHKISSCVLTNRTPTVGDYRLLARCALLTSGHCTLYTHPPSRAQRTASRGPAACWRRRRAGLQGQGGRDDCVDLTLH